MSSPTVGQLCMFPEDDRLRADDLGFDWNPPPGTIQFRFLRFHAAHPEIYAHLVRKAYRLFLSGESLMGIGDLTEDLRWGDEKIPICNDYRSRYVRLILLEHPLLRGCFRLREIKSA